MVATKGNDASRRLTRNTPNTGGAKSYKRKLLAILTQSIMFCGAPVWAKHMGRRAWNIILDRSNKKIGLRVAVYGTVSIMQEAVELIAEMPPPELIAEYTHTRGRRKVGS